MGAIIKSHNKQQLHDAEPEKPCNCRVKANCPLGGECQAREIVYEAAVSAEGETKRYIGISDPPFKTRFANHLTSIRNERYMNSTELAKHAWQLKSEGKEFDLKWQIRERSKSYRCESKRCNLCAAEKFHILTSKKESTLNKRTELVSKCRHETKFRLASFTPVT